MNVFFVPKGKYYPEEVLLRKIINFLGYDTYSLYSTSKAFGNLKVVILYDRNCFADDKYKEWIGVEDSWYMPVVKLLIQRDYNGKGFEYSLFGDNYVFPSYYHDDSLLELLRSKYPYLPDNLDFYNLNSEEAISLFNAKFEKAREKENELYEKIAKYHKDCLREQEEYEEWIRQQEYEEEIRTWFEEEGYRDAYDGDPSALWNTE